MIKRNEVTDAANLGREEKAWSPRLLDVHYYDKRRVVIGRLYTEHEPQTAVDSRRDGLTQPYSTIKDGP